MPRYLLSLPIDKLVKGGQYRPLPTHSTLVQTFAFDDVEVLTRTINNICAISWPVQLIAMGRDMFGENHDVPVTLLRQTGALTALHLAFWGALYGIGATMENPGWGGLGYRPHVSDYRGQRFPANGVSEVEEIALIERRHDLNKWEVVVELFQLKTPPT